MATFTILCMAAPKFSLSIRGGKVILAATNPKDPNQEWYKDEKYAQGVSDDIGRRAFALVNKGTGQAIKHATGHAQLVELVPFTKSVDKSLLWAKGVGKFEGYSPIWMLNNLNLAFDAEAANTKPFDGTLIKMWDWNGGVNQLWRIVPNLTTAPVRIYTMAAPKFSLSIRNGKVILATTNPKDPNQQWEKNEKYAKGVQDDIYRNANAFALVNKGTGQAIKHATGHAQPVELVAFNPNSVDKSLLWTKGADWVEGNSPIWMLNNLDLALDAEAANTKPFDGTLIKMWKWNGGLNQLWSIVLY